MVHITGQNRESLVTEYAIPPSLEERLRQWLGAMPTTLHQLIEDFPPLSRVEAKLGVVLLIPAPGVVGAVISYTNDGFLGVRAPIGATVTNQQGETIPAGTVLSAPCKPSEMRYIGPGGPNQITKADVKKVRESLV